MCPSSAALWSCTWGHPGIDERSLIPGTRRKLTRFQTSAPGISVRRHGFSRQIRQGKRYVRAAGRAFRIARSAGGDDYVLPPIDHVGCRGCIAGIRQSRLPEKLAGSGVECVELAVVHGGADEQYSATGDDGAAVEFAAGVLHS